MDKSQSPLSKSSTPSPSHREALTPGAAGPSTSCLRLVSKAASSADPLGEQNATIGWVPGRRWCLSAPPPLLLPLLQALLALPLSSLPSSPQSHVCAPRFIPGSFWRGVARRAERRAGQPGRLRRRSDSVPANQRRGQRLLAQPHGEATPPPPPSPETPRIGRRVTGCVFPHQLSHRRQRSFSVWLRFLHQVAYDSRSHLRAPGLSSSLPGSSGGKP